MRRCRERWQEGTDEIEERASEGEREREREQIMDTQQQLQLIFSVMKLLVGISRSFISFVLFSRGYLTVVTECGNRVAEKEGRKVRPCPATAAKNDIRKSIHEMDIRMDSKQYCHILSKH